MTAFVSLDTESITDPGRRAYLEKCAALQLAMQGDLADAGPLTLKKRASNLFRHRAKQHAKIDVRDFSSVLSVDLERMVVEAEGMAPFDAIVEATLRKGCLPTVVPELKSITIGGALSGIGIESSSFRFGLVHETIIAFDVLLSNGDIVTCRPDNEHSDLFFAFPNSYGTLGYALRVEMQLVAAKPRLRLSHQHFYKPEVLFERLEALCLENRQSGLYDYIEAVAFGEHDLVLSTGRFVNQVPYLHDYTHMKIYYESLLNRTTDYLTAKDYIWRWDTDWFWCSKVFGMQYQWLRFLVGRWCLNSRFYSKMMRFMHRNRLAKHLMDRFTAPSESVIQDVVIPIENALAFFEFFNAEIGITPFWMCPIYPYNDSRRFPLFSLEPQRLYVNFGFWSSVESTREPGHYNRLIEQKVTALGGMKSLYSSAYYSESEFWAIYDKDAYDALKRRYDPTGRFGNLYEKCTEKG